MSRLTDSSRDSRDCDRVILYCDQKTANQRLWEYENLGSVESFNKERKQWKVLSVWLESMLDRARKELEEMEF